MKQCALNYINNEILRQACKLKYIVKDMAPSTESELFNESSLVIWSGASDETIYQDSRINYTFRALHDAEHLAIGLDFSIENEVAIGLMQASKQTSDLMRELFHSEIVSQALYYKNSGGLFVSNQLEFTKTNLKGLI